MKKLLLLIVCLFTIGAKSQTITDNAVLFDAAAPNLFADITQNLYVDGNLFQQRIARFDTTYLRIYSLDSNCVSVDTSQRFLTVNKYGIIEIRNLKTFSPHTDTCSTTSGTAVFYLTDDGTSIGTALYPNGNIWPQFIINDVSKVYAYSWVLSNSNRTLTVTVKYQDHDFMSGLYMTNAPNNTLVRMTVTGN